MKKYDVIVIGGGHAGIESAMACRKIGVDTLLITFEKEKIGYMSCNPAIGGVGKGQIVKEIDALGGEMAKATDATGIQFRILNSSKGPAVWSTRAQVDRKKYNEYMKNLIELNVEILEGEVTDLIIENNSVKGVEVNNQEIIYSRCVILAPGTFLNGVIHIGLDSFPAGRIEEKKVSIKLSEKLKQLGFEILRFKTGTCARLDGNTIDFSVLTPQYGDEPPKPFSFSTEKLEIKQLPCYITYTNEKTHKIIKENLDRSPLFTGKIIGTGVRYCPSIEDKVVKFPHHSRHHIFLEPEGKEADVYYPNGISTSLPIDVQDEFIHTIKGLENVKILRYGYGIEHNVVNPLQIYPTLETKLIGNLFLAGQINGTTGYEEAAGQGLIAGINACLKIKNKQPLILDRTTSYIGVLIDDLTTKGTNEPYRMFTSRVEYRLMIREDNADIRLREIGYKIGLLSKEEWEKTKEKIEQINKIKNYLKNRKIKIEGKTIPLFEYIRRPNIKISDYIDLKEFNKNAIFTAEVEIKYAPYIERNLKEIEEFKNLEKIKIPPTLDYKKIPGLSLEIIEKLNSFKPLNLGQASRIAGITPSAISILMVYLKKYPV
ncbi:MAG: tRNA uridine-5-carboxymethylaminomethyl(34) synthesis enzyme MnmG [Candidatus Omnitrophica bacterium]|nr:tRNA uridine-5-carboxymethylaminomethyl(34) synthesis enzyme MnmG [Candidatus Omnitrophota bacterium]